MKINPAFEFRASTGEPAFPTVLLMVQPLLSALDQLRRHVTNTQGSLIAAVWWRVRMGGTDEQLVARCDTLREHLATALEDTARALRDSARPARRAA